MEDLIELYKKRDALAKENADTSEITNIINENWVVKEPKPILLTHSYYENPDFYEHYDNYDAIEVPRVELIPYDYEGVMGVPLTFLGARNRIYFCAKTQQNSNFLHLFSCTQFEIIALGNSRENFTPNKDYIKPIKVLKDGKKVNGNAINCVLAIESKTKPINMIYYTSENVPYLIAPYARILIKKLS